MKKKATDTRDYAGLEGLCRAAANVAIAGLVKDASRLGYDHYETRVAFARLVTARTWEIDWDEHQKVQETPRAVKRLVALLDSGEADFERLARAEKASQTPVT